MLLAISGYEDFRCLMTTGEKSTLKASKNSGVNDAISKGGGMENAMQKDAW